jgi:acyl carrier protein
MPGAWRRGSRIIGRQERYFLIQEGCVKDYDAIIKDLESIIAGKTKLEPEHIDPDLNLEESGLDSFARIELVLLIEDHFGFEMSDSEAASLATVDDVVKIIMARQAAA